MKNTYDDLDKLLDDMKSDIEETLSKEVFEEVRNIELEHIATDVIASYHPKVYERRSTEGIEDYRNIICDVKDMELVVDNVTPFNPNYGTWNKGNNLADLINEGDGGKSRLYYDFNGEFRRPRPFLDNTQEEVDKSGRVERAFSKGMKKHGYSIK